MILIDSSVLIDYFNGTYNWQVEKLNNLLGKEFLSIGDYILTEVLQGFKNDKDFQKAKNILKAFPCFDLLGEDVAIKSAQNFRYLRKKGITVRKTIDSIIATYCIENNLSLLHNDNDFKPFEKYLGLQVAKK